MPYAVIKTGGKQYRVEEGQTLLVERLPGEAGDKVDVETLLIAGDGDPSFEGTVAAEVVGHEKGQKLRVVKFKPKRGYKRRTGHRQGYTRIRITSIGGSKSPRPPATTSRSNKAEAKKTEEASA